MRATALECDTQRLTPVLAQDDEGPAHGWMAAWIPPDFQDYGPGDF